MIAARLQIRNLTRAIEKAVDLQTSALTTVEAAVRATIGLMVGHVVKNKLRGQYLNRRTGTLIRSVTASQRFERTSTSVAGAFGTNLDYGIRHEQGFTGEIEIPAHRVGPYTRAAHTRTSKAGRAVQVRAHAVRAHTIRAHTATVVVRARYYLRDAFVEKLPDARRNIARALEILNETGKPASVPDLRSKV